MRYPRVYDISQGARCILLFYVRGAWQPTSYNLNDSAFKELLDRKYLEIVDGKVVVLAKHPRVYKRDSRGNLIPMKMDIGKGFYPRYQ